MIHYLIIILLLSILIGWSFRQSLQTKRTMGGAISLPKLYWLLLALNVYYSSPILLLVFLQKSSPSLQILTTFLIFMALRMIIQLYLMYVKKAWLPKYGIIFNILGALLLLALGLYFWEDLQQKTSFLILPWMGIAIFCQALDTYYAWMFFKMVGTRTQSHNPIWFANSEEARFTSINRTTFFFNVLISLFIGYVLIKNYFLC